MVVSFVVEGRDLLISDIRRCAAVGGQLRQWSNVVDKRFGTHSERIGLVEILRDSAPVKPLAPLLVQLLRRLALKVESVVGAMSQKSKSELVGSLSKFLWLGALSVIGKDQDAFVTKYMLSARHALGKERMYYMATDKAQACRLPLQNTCVGTVNNLVVLAPPNVRRRGRGVQARGASSAGDALRGVLWRSGLWRGYLEFRLHLGAVHKCPVPWLRKICAPRRPGGRTQRVQFRPS